MTRRGFVAAFLIALSMARGFGAQSLSFTQVGTIPGPADLVEADGHYVYVAAAKTLRIVDVVDPAAPKTVGSYAFPELIWGVTPSGSRVYVAGDTFGLGILDVSNPAQPALVGSLRTPGQAKAVALIDDGRAIVADHVAGLDLVDLRVPSRPALVTSYFVEGFAKDVIARGALLYAIDQPTGLSVFDFSRSTSEPVGTAVLAIPLGLRAQLDVSDTRRHRLAVVAGAGPLQVYDVSDPRKPTHASTYRTPGNALRVALQGSSLYVAAGPAGLQVVDLSTPSAPAVVGTYAVMGARDVAIAGSLVFLAVAGDRVDILRQGP